MVHTAILTLVFCLFFPSQRCNNINLLKCSIHHRFKYLFYLMGCVSIVIIAYFGLNKEST